MDWRCLATTEQGERDMVVKQLVVIGHAGRTLRDDGHHLVVALSCPEVHIGMFAVIAKSECRQGTSACQMGVKSAPRSIKCKWTQSISGTNGQ